MLSFPSILLLKLARPAILTGCTLFGLLGCLRQPIEPSPDKDVNELSYGAAVDIEGCGVSAFMQEITAATTTVSGDLDWVHYGYQGVNDVNRKATGNGQIKKDNIGTVVHYPPPIAPYVKSFNWSGGTPIASRTTNNGIRADKLNEGFNVRIPAGTAARMATLYVSTVNAQGRLTVDIPGGEVQPAVVLVDSKGSSNGYRSFIFTVYFRAKSPKELSIKWIKTEDYNAGKGTIVLHGAGLSPFNDTPPQGFITGVVTDGYKDIAIAGKPHKVMWSYQTQYEGIRNIQLYRNGALVASANGNTGFPAMTVTSTSMAQYDISITDNLGNRAWSNSFIYYLWSEYYTPGPSSIPDNYTPGTTWSFFHQYGGMYMGDLRLYMNAIHPYVGDLKVTLTSPSGGEWTVLNGHGGSGDNVSNFAVSESFSGDISTASAPFTGRFKPFAVNSPILSKVARGTWYVKVQDLALYDVGEVSQIIVVIRDP